MNLRDLFSLKNRSFSFFILISMILLVLCIVAFFGVSDYIFTKNNFDHESTLLEIQSEQNIEGAMRLTDIAWNIFDSNLNERMANGLGTVIGSYNSSGANPAVMDLGKLKQDLGGDMDIYLINESGVIEYTTYQPELGQDFRSVPYFYDYLSKIRMSSGFFPDRVVHELLGAGQFRKYAYMPTPDHKYVLELGLSGTSVDQVRTVLDTKDTIDKIVAVNPYITQYRIFNTMGRRSDNNKLPEENVRGYLNQTISTRKTLEVIDQVKGEKIHYLFVDLKDEQSGSDPSRVVEITYNTGLQQDVLNRLIIYHILIALIAICLGCAIALFLSRRQIRPIQEIIFDVEKISKGDLNHRIR